MVGDELDESEEGQTVLHPGRRESSPSLSKHFLLRVIDGPDAGATFRMTTAVRVLVGQSQACEIRLSDELVSRRHAAIEMEDERLHVSDLGSTNGTFINGVRVVDAYLSGGETLSVGRSTFEVVRGPDQPAPRDSGSAASGFGPVLGASPAMRRLYPVCERLAASDVALVIEGETGTGKEVLAEALHLASARAGGPFVVFDCTAVPSNLMESELFGHEKGAFTGAASARKGVFEQAEGGTLLIDEIGDLELALQPKLLRAVERREIRRLGGDRAIRVDVRLLAATRRDLDREVQAGRFRDDLFHRVAVTRIELPPLRNRKGDVRVLARHFARELGQTPPEELLARWEDQPWPGNIRELRNAVARWVALGELAIEAIEEEEPVEGEPEGAPAGDLVERVLSQRLPLTQARQRIIESFERRYIERMLAESGGNVGRAAVASGIGRRYFQMLLARRT